MRRWLVFVLFCQFAVHAGDDAAQALRQRLLRERLLDHFCFGVEAPQEWLQETNRSQGTRWDCRVAYLSGKLGPSMPVDDQWFFKFGMVERSLKEAPKLPVTLWWTFYALAASHPAYYKPGPAQATPVNAKVLQTMRLYFETFKKLMVLSGKQPDALVVVQIEPDEWCHLLISGGMDPRKVDVKVGSCGLEELKGLPDDLFGYAAAFVRLRNLYAPNNVLLGCNPSGWDYKNNMSGKKMGALFKEVCPGFELAVFETGDRDKSSMNKQPPFGDKINICNTLDEHINWISEFHQASGLYVFVWQVAMGNTFFASCDGTPGHHMDNLTQMLLEDYPKNPTIGRYVQAGCAGFMFNGGQDFSTRVYDAKKDGITNPPPAKGNAGNKSEFADDDGGYLRLRAANYYRKPYPILSKAAPQKTATTAPVPAPRPVATTTTRRKAAGDDVVAAWTEKLKTQLKAVLQAGRAPRFEMKTLGAKVTLKSLSDKDEAKVTLESGGGLDVPWRRFDLRDRQNLAVALAADGDGAVEQQLAAFFVLQQTGDAEAARKHLEKLPDQGDEILALFPEENKAK